MRPLTSGSQRNEIRVPCTRDVLTTVFGTPMTDMALIARKILSPVRDMRMIGHDLRGEKSGGTVRCRIARVFENLGLFTDRHHYHYRARYFG